MRLKSCLAFGLTCCTAYKETISRELLSKLAGRLGMRSAATKWTLWKARDTVVASLPLGTTSNSRSTASQLVVNLSPVVSLEPVERREEGL